MIAGLCCLAITVGVNAQNTGAKAGSADYSNGIGVRAGFTSGITFKHFFNTGNAGEFIVGFWHNAVGLTALYEHHMPVGPKGLKFYYGGGAHITAGANRPFYRRHGRWDDPNGWRYGRNGFAVGIDGIAGLEYKVTPIPLAISLDLKPLVEVSNYGDIYTAFDAGLGIKLAF